MGDHNELHGNTESDKTEEDEITLESNGGGLVNSINAASDDNEDDDTCVYDGVGRTEPTMGEIEEDHAECHVTQYPNVADCETLSCFSCNSISCCYGCRQCLRRTAVEVSSVYVDVKQITTNTLRQRCSRTSWTQWSRTQFPVTQWLPRYTLKHLRGDVVAGLTTGLSVIPQGLAYGQIVELAPQAREFIFFESIGFICA